MAVRIAVQADFVTEFAAEHLPDGNAPRLAGQIPAGHFQRADAARLPRIAAELLDAAEDLLHIARILAENPRLQHRGIGATGCVANFAVADKSLIRIDFHQRAAFRRAVDIRKTDIRDFQRIRIDFLGFHDSIVFYIKH